MEEHTEWLPLNFVFDNIQRLQLPPKAIEPNLIKASQKSVNFLWFSHKTAVKYKATMELRSRYLTSEKAVKFGLLFFINTFIKFKNSNPFKLTVGKSYVKLKQSPPPNMG